MKTRCIIIWYTWVRFGIAVLVWDKRFNRADWVVISNTMWIPFPHTAIIVKTFMLIIHSFRQIQITMSTMEARRCLLGSSRHGAHFHFNCVCARGVNDCHAHSRAFPFKNGGVLALLCVEAMSTPTPTRGFYSRPRRVESARRIRTPTNLREDSGLVAESGLQYQPRELLYDRPSLRQHLDDGDSDSGDEGNPESALPSASLSFASKSPFTPLSGSSLHNSRQSEPYSSEIIGMLQQQQQLLHKVLAEMKKENQMLLRQLLSLEEEVRTNSSSSSNSSTPRRKCKITHDLTVYIHIPSVLL